MANEIRDDAFVTRVDAQDVHSNTCVTEPDDGENMQDSCDHDL